MSETKALAFEDAARQIIDAGKTLDARGWAPATAGNYSARILNGKVAITVSGRPKGALTTADVMIVDERGHALDARRPSAETPLHTLMYRLDPSLGAVLHTHSVTTTVLGLSQPGRTTIELRGYELLKAFPGISTHETSVAVPIFENTQDMGELGERVAERWHRAPFIGYVIRGHGLYAWGPTMSDALRCTEALEFLFACELELRRFR